MNDQEDLDTIFVPPQYHTYLLRCWQERSIQAEEAIKVWRFSLENPRTGHRHGFASLEALLAWLLIELVEE